MAVVFSFSGSRFYIGGPVAFTQSDLNESDFSSQSGLWTEVKGIESIGPYGDSAAYGSFIGLGDRRTTRFLTHFEAADMQITMARNSNDAGQAAILAAGDDAGTNYAIRIVYDDAPPGGTPTEDMFIGLVGPMRRSGGSNADALKWEALIGGNSNVVTVPAGVSGSAPNNTGLPAITGTAEEDEVLTASTGTWTGTPAPSYAYQWFLSGESIPDATAPTYTIVAGDVGKTISVMVTATNILGTAHAMSADTATITS